MLKVIGIKKETDDRVKDETIIINKGFSKTSFGIFFGYGHGPSGSIFNVSLPCPVQSCRLGGFSQIYDKYLPELKHYLLTSNNLDTIMPKSNVPKEYPTK